MPLVSQGHHGARAGSGRFPTGLINYLVMLSKFFSNVGFDFKQFFFIFDQFLSIWEVFDNFFEFLRSRGFFWYLLESGGPENHQNLNKPYIFSFLKYLLLISVFVGAVVIFSLF